MSTPQVTMSRAVIIAALALAAMVVGAPLLTSLHPDAAPNARGATDTAALAKGITVEGTGTVTISPDLATITLGVQAQAGTAAQAQSSASAAMARIIGAVKRLGIADTDLTTQWVSLQPQYSQEPAGALPPRVSGYVANQTLSVKDHRPDQAGLVIDAAVGAGATQVNGISFSLADPTSAAAQARAAAMADAKQHATALAQAAGVTLGSLLAVSEITAPVPVPVPYDAGALARGVTTPVQLGTTNVEVSVQATFAIGG